jgi:hypothetical protein
MAQKKEISSTQEEKQRASYGDYDEILIPTELKLDRKNSFVYGTTRSEVGFLIFKGRIEPSSLAGFFQNNRRKEGWKFLSTLKHREYRFTFRKRDRVGVINITEKAFPTLGEIGVGPIEPTANQIEKAPPRSSLPIEARVL